MGSFWQQSSEQRPLRSLSSPAHYLVHRSARPGAAAEGVSWGLSCGPAGGSCPWWPSALQTGSGKRPRELCGAHLSLMGKRPLKGQGLSRGRGWGDVGANAPNRRQALAWLCLDSVSPTVTRAAVLCGVCRECSREESHARAPRVLHNLAPPVPRGQTPAQSGSWGWGRLGAWPGSHLPDTHTHTHSYKPPQPSRTPGQSSALFRCCSPCL